MFKKTHLKAGLFFQNQTNKQIWKRFLFQFFPRKVPLSSETIRSLTVNEGTSEQNRGRNDVRETLL